jgi:hypothetical protein
MENKLKQGAIAATGSPNHRGRLVGSKMENGSSDLLQGWENRLAPLANEQEKPARGKLMQAVVVAQTSLRKIEIGKREALPRRPVREREDADRDQIYREKMSLGQEIELKDFSLHEKNKPR